MRRDLIRKMKVQDDNAPVVVDGLQSIVPVLYPYIINRSHYDYHHVATATAAATVMYWNR
jgi:hypothetical protein